MGGGEFSSRHNGRLLNGRGFNRAGTLSSAEFSTFGVGFYLKYGRSLHISHQEWRFSGFCSTQAIQQSPGAKWAWPMPTVR